MPAPDNGQMSAVATGPDTCELRRRLRGCSADREERALKDGVARRAIGHAGGMALSLATIAQAPRIMDAIICTLSAVGIVAMEGGCASGSAALGESGASLSWAIGPPLLGLVAIMELAMWLQRLYMAPRWAPPVVALVGCPALLGLIGGNFGGLPGFGWELGAIMGVPVALAFTAYWIPLSLSQVGTVREAGAQRAAEQLDAPDEAGAVASAGRRLRR